MRLGGESNFTLCYHLTTLFVLPRDGGGSARGSMDETQNGINGADHRRCIPPEMGEVYGNTDRLPLPLPPPSPHQDPPPTLERKLGGPTCWSLKWIGIRLRLCRCACPHHLQTSSEKERCEEGASINLDPLLVACSACLRGGRHPARSPINDDDASNGLNGGMANPLLAAPVCLGCYWTLFALF